MNIYDAIMRAADHIEARPQLFNFRRIAVPGDCNTPGCALGWINFFSRTDAGWLVRLEFDLYDENGRPGISAAVLGLDAGDFYERMHQFGIGWSADATACARALRLYADKYHSPKAIPESVWRIFETDGVAA